MKKTIFTFLLCTLFSVLFAQENKEKKTIYSQFSDVIESANNYKDYKVVKQFRLEQLKKNTIQEIDNLNQEISDANDTIDTQKKELVSVKEELKNLEADLKQLSAEKNQISFLGIATNKTTYQLVMWAVIFVLLLILLLFIYKYNSSNKLTREAQQNLKDQEDEFEAYRKKSLEQQQKLGRQLQDERNKLSKNNKK